MRQPLRAGLVTLAVVVLHATPVRALPRFALRDGVACSTCHVNPSGGGMRNRYARYVFEPTRLAVGVPGPAALLRPLDVDIGDTLSFGADGRTIYYDQSVPGSDGIGSFFQMQADLYVSAELVEGLTLYFDQGSYGSFEAIAMYEHGLGAPGLSAYVKAGRFMPTFGLRLENHNTFTRQDIGFGPRDKDAGIEIGAYLGPVLVQAAVLDGASEDRQFDENRKKAFLARAELIGRVGALRLMFGGSAYANQTGARTEVQGTVVDSRSDHLRTGVHWGLGLGRFAYLGEAAVVKVDPSQGNAQEAKQFSFQSYQELDVRLVRGLELNFNYEFREPDIDLESGRINRFAGGVELYPLPYLELKVLVRHAFGSGPAVAEQDGVDEVIGMAHLFF
ncbi:MAG: hypothetical protein HYY06_05475 [Deltaproteobacteria bacterium]|nr:hypothetical protein [Deltaproteobacteria bacterium]